MATRSASEGCGRALLGASAIVHLYFGAWFAIDAGPLMASLSIAPTAPAGLAEMRAFYGGLMLALGALFAIAVLRRSRTRDGLILMTATYLGAALVRGSWMAIDGIGDAWIWQLLAIESGGALGGALCLAGGAFAAAQRSTP
jgi:hypothetical protein